MNRDSIIAAMCLAYNVAEADGLQEEEAAILEKELASFKLSDNDRQSIINQYKELPIFRAVEVIRKSDEETRKEANALVMLSTLADGVLSEREQGAYSIIAKLCYFKKMTLEEAHEQLKF